MRLKVLTVALLLCHGAPAQLNSSFSSAGGVTTVTMTVRPGAPNYAFAGAPYSAKQSHDRVQTLAGGTRLAQKTMYTTIVQDTEGRKRTEREFQTGLPTQKAAVVVEILDPVDGVYYVLDPMAAVAHRVKVNVKLTRISGTQRHPPSGPPNTISNADGSTFTAENLGSKVLAGLTVWGTRTTMRYPAGSIMGNDRPVESVNEAWNAPQLGTSVVSTNSDPRIGDSTTELRDIVVGEPDPALLRPPVGYKIVEESGPFVLTLP